MNYEQRLEDDVAEITSRVIAIAADVERALQGAVRALLDADLELGYDTILGDHAINRQVRALDRRCHGFVVRHLPSAKHLRMVSSVLRIGRELERIGDYAATIGRVVGQLRTPPPPPVAANIELLAGQARQMLRQSIRAFEDQSADAARATMVIENQIDAMFDKLFNDLGDQEGNHPIKELFLWLIVLNRLERVSDRAKNICDEVVFWSTGEGKSPKVFNILFLDRRNGCISQMAEALARKAFPDSGRYSSAGTEPVAKLNEHVAEFMGGLGCDLSRHQPTQLETSPEALTSFHVVVGIGLEPAEILEETPFHTVLLEWEGLPCPMTAEEAERTSRTLLHRIDGLMETLHGDDAG